MSNTIFLRFSNYETEEYRLFLVPAGYRTEICNWLDRAVRTEKLQQVRVEEVAKGGQINCFFHSCIDMNSAVLELADRLPFEEVPLPKQDFERILDFSAKDSTVVKIYTFNKVWRVDILRILVDLQDSSEGTCVMHVTLSEDPTGNISCQFETEADLLVAETELSQYLKKA